MERPEHVSTPSLFRVGIARCESYSLEHTQNALRQAVERAGGWPKLPAKVLLKANLLAPRAPEDAATTHPAILKSLVRELRQRTSVTEITVGDSPGFLYAHQQEDLFQRTGLRALAKEEGCTLALLSEEGFSSVSPPEAHVLLQAQVATKYLTAPAVINVGKLKTHVETKISACIKNIFGIADTPTRKRAHATRDGRHLIHAIVDLYTIRPPVFAVLDAVEAMEGNGPSHGHPKFLGWILAGENALAVDMVAAHIMGYSDPQEIPLLKAAMSRGIGPAHKSHVVLEGASWPDIISQDFRKSTSLLEWVPPGLKSLLYQITALRPTLAPMACTSCGVCAHVCPVDAITLKQGTPIIDRKKCVCCMCCHEMCPSGAMQCQPSLLAQIMLRWRPPHEPKHR